MMEAVRDGKADAAFVYYYMAQAFINSDTTGTMTYTLLEQPTFSYRMVVSSTENHALAGILTKAMYAMPDNLVEDLATQYTTYKATNLTLVDMICLHPVTAVAIIVFISWMAVTLIVILNRLQTRRKLQLAAQQKAKEMTVLAEQAQVASKAKSTFLSNMTHDIRTPMNAIIGFTNIALHQDSVPEMHNCLKKIKESSDHLLESFSQISETFTLFVQRNWTVLRQWDGLLKNADIDHAGSIGADMQANKESWHYSDFYLFNESTQYLTADGRRGSADSISGVFQEIDRKSTRLNSSHPSRSRMPSSA